MQLRYDGCEVRSGELTRTWTTGTTRGTLPAKPWEGRLWNEKDAHARHKLGTLKTPEFLAGRKIPGKKTRDCPYDEKNNFVGGVWGDVGLHVGRKEPGEVELFLGGLSLVFHQEKKRW